MEDPFVVGALMGCIAGLIAGVLLTASAFHWAFFGRMKQ